LCRISTILQKSSTSKAALEMDPRVGLSGAHGFPLVTSPVNLPNIIEAPPGNAYNPDQKDIHAMSYETLVEINHY